MNNKKRVRGYKGIFFYKSHTRKVNGRPDECFYITFKIDGRKKTEKIGWKSEGYSAKVAEDIRAKRVRDIRHGKTVKTAQEIQAEKRMHDRPLGEIKDTYFSDTGLNIKGRKTDLNRWDKHLSALSKKRVSGLSQLDVERIKHGMKGKAPATIANTLELLRRLINYGVKHKLCPALPFTIKLPEKNNEDTEEYLTDEEAQRLIEVLKTWHRQDVARMVRLAWLTGMRRGEIFKLQRKSVDFEKSIISLKNPKGGKDAFIPMSRPVHDLLKEQIQWTAKNYPGSPYVFPGRAGRQRVDCSSVERIKKAAGLPKSFRPFHGLRHHYAVMLASSGEYTLDMIGSLLTHRSTAVTKRYAKFLQDAKKKAADRAAELLTGQTRKAEVADIAGKRTA